MTILVTGAAGFLGNLLVKRLVADGQPVRALVRSAAKAKIRLGGIADRIEIVPGDVTRADSLEPAMRGARAVVHTVAIALEKGGQTYESVNYEGTLNVLRAAEAAGVQRFINISQNGAKADLPYRFLASKGRAQTAVAASNLAWTALRPSAIFGAQDEFFNTFARLLKITPLVFPLIDGGKAEFQPVSAQDVVEAALRCLDDDSTVGAELALGGPEVLTLGEIERRVLDATGSLRLLVPVPAGLLRPVVAVMQRLLPGSPVNTSLLELLAVPNTVPENALVTRFGMSPTPFAGEHIAYLRENTVGDTLAKFFGNATIN
ncbi:MAG: complex I NDUFA9 subunit family protein [Chloroflexi bacterium]|nr:complex I NDUFA9 subunit family protein [Chloroflexota bacterium]MCY4247597.1 complex I NDUFA9 subunit family protein [Chloroflexota bacterium]